MLALQNPQTKLWDIHGTVTKVGPHRPYYIRTHSGRILVRNRRFLRRRVPISSTASATTPDFPNHDEQPPNQDEQLPNQEEQPVIIPQQIPAPRRSSRTHKPSQRLIEDANWP